MRKFVVDANAFLRFILNDIPEQADKTENLIKQAKANKAELIVPQIVIFEIVFTLDKYYGFARLEIVDKVKSILSVSYLKVQNREILKKALELYGENNISLTDNFLIYFAEQKEADIFTFDRKLKNLQKPSR